MTARPMNKRRRGKKSLDAVEGVIVTLASEAAEKIKSALGRYSASGVRLSARQHETGTVSYSLDLEDKTRHDDLVLEEKGIRFYVDPDSARHVQEIEIRYVATKEQSGFAISHSGSG